MTVNNKHGIYFEYSPASRVDYIDTTASVIQSVHVCGDFNGWKRSTLWQLQQSDDGFCYHLFVSHIPDGIYKYKFLITYQTATDQFKEEWVPDLENPLHEKHGYQNSLLVVGQEHYTRLMNNQIPDLQWEWAWNSTAAGETMTLPIYHNARPLAFRVISPTRINNWIDQNPKFATPRNANLQRILQHNTRPLHVFLPPSYGTGSATSADPNSNNKNNSSRRRFPVLYLHDGQNVWSNPNCCAGNGGWHVDQTLNELWAQSRSGGDPLMILPEFIVVGIPCLPSARMQEYGTSDFLGTLLMQSDSFVEYVTQVVKPFIDSQFSTLGEDPASNIVMGSSLGGLVSMVTLLAHPETFGSAACLSPAFWWEDEQKNTVFDQVRLFCSSSSSSNNAANVQPQRHQQQRDHRLPRIYLDSGDIARDNTYVTREMANLLEQLGWRVKQQRPTSAVAASMPTTNKPLQQEEQEVDVVYVEDLVGGHDERAWRFRFPQAMHFLLQK